MHLLVTNDDGVYAKGIKALVTHLSKRFKVTVVAPDRQQSATSHAITLHKPLHVDKVNFGHAAVTAYHVNGTPADCVKLALGALCEKPPDLVISGINSGANLGLDIMYSGTAAAAAEAVLQGYSAIAVSLTGPPFDFSASAQIAERLIDAVTRRDGLPPDTYLNVNVPPGPYEKLAGIAITRTGVRKYRNSYERRIDPLGRSYYWQVGEVLQMHNDADTDVRAVEVGKVSVTPVHFDFTNGSLLVTLKEWGLTL